MQDLSKIFLFTYVIEVCFTPATKALHYVLIYTLYTYIAHMIITLSNFKTIIRFEVRLDQMAACDKIC